MSFTSKTAAAAAIALSMALGGASAAFAKAHDQGVADSIGGFSPGDSAGGVSPAGGSAVSDGQKNGARGDTAKAAKSGNATEPTNAPGQN